MFSGSTFVGKNNNNAPIRAHYYYFHKHFHFCSYSILQFRFWYIDINEIIQFSVSVPSLPNSQTSQPDKPPTDCPGVLVVIFTIRETDPF